MARNQYQLQAEKLRELEAHIHSVSRDVQNIMKGYTQKVSGLASEGLPMEVHDKVMAEFYLPSQNCASKVSQICDQAVQYVRSQIQGLEQLIGR